MKKRLFGLLLCALFLLFSTTTTFAIPPIAVGPYQIELEGGLVLQMTDDRSASRHGHKPSGLYRNGELVYAMGTFIPKDYLLHVSDDGMFIFAFWPNYRDHWMLAHELCPEGIIGRVEVYYMGNLVDTYKIAGLWFYPSGSRWPGSEDLVLNIMTAGVLHRRELAIDLSDNSIISEQEHFNTELIQYITTNITTSILQGFLQGVRGFR